MNEFTPVSPITMQLAEMPEGQPVVTLDPGRFRLSGVRAVREVVAYSGGIDDPRDIPIDRAEGRMDFAVSGTDHDYTVSAAIDQETGATTVSLDHPEHATELFIGLSALTRGTGAQSLRAAIFGSSDVVTDRPLNVSGSFQEPGGTRLALSVHEQRIIAELESSGSIQADAELAAQARQMSQAQEPIYSTQNVERADGGRTLVVSRADTELPALAETMAKGVRNVLNFPSGIEDTLAVANAATASMLDVPHLDALRGAWNVGMLRPRGRAVAARTVLDELRRFSQ